MFNCLQGNSPAQEVHYIVHVYNRKGRKETLKCSLNKNIKKASEFHGFSQKSPKGRVRRTHTAKGVVERQIQSPPKTTSVLCPRDMLQQDRSSRILHQHSPKYKNLCIHLAYGLILIPILNLFKKKRERATTYCGAALVFTCELNQTVINSAAF